MSFCELVPIFVSICNHGASILAGFHDKPKAGLKEYVFRIIRDDKLHESQLYNFISVFNGEENDSEVK